MATSTYFADDNLRAKLSSLTEAHESITTVSQWLIFHKRYSARVAELWLERITEAPPAKKLSLIYLANETIQQSKARKKLDYVIAFEPIIAQGTANAYKAVPLDTQQKIRRVIEVWRQRSIFDENIQMDIEAKVDEVDRTRASKRGGIASSLFASSESSAPPLFLPVIKSHGTLVKAETLSSIAISSFTKSHDEIRGDTSSNLSIKAAQLGTLLRSLNDVEVAIAQSITARQELLAGLEKLVADNKAALVQENEQARRYQSQRQAIEDERKHVEDLIVRGISDPSAYEPPRPDAEPLTPPPVESITPVGSPRDISTLDTAPADLADPPAVALKHPVDMSDTNGHSEPSAKKRKIEDVQDGDFLGALDPDVEQMLQ